MLFTHPDSDFSHPPPYPCFSLRFSLLLHSPSWMIPYNNNLKVNQLICYYHLTWSSRLRIVPRPFGCRSRSRAGCPLRRSIPGQSRAVPRLRAAPDSAAAAAPPLRSRPAPPRRRPQLSALTSALRPGQGSPSPLPPPRSLRSRSGQPHLVFTSGLGSSPHPLGPAAAPGHPELPLSLCGAVLAASPLRFSAPPVLVCSRTPALPGQPGGRAASGRGEGVRRGVEE